MRDQANSEFLTWPLDIILLPYFEVGAIIWTFDNSWNHDLENEWLHWAHGNAERSVDKIGWWWSKSSARVTEMWSSKWPGCSPRLPHPGQLPVPQLVVDASLVVVVGLNVHPVKSWNVLMKPKTPPSPSPPSPQLWLWAPIHNVELFPALHKDGDKTFWDVTCQPFWAEM